VSFCEVVLIAFGLALDAFAVALAAGATGRAPGRRAAFRLSFHFGLFQFAMPVAGWLAGSIVAERIGRYDHWVAFALLAFVGARMLRSGLGREDHEETGDPSRGLSLIMLSIATSIDALAIGLSLAMLGVGIWYPSVVIGIVAGGMTLAGLRIGGRLGRLFGRRMEFAGGLVLIGIGARILVEHLA